MASNEGKARPAAKFALIWFPDKERPNVIDFNAAMGQSTPLDSSELLASTTAAIEYAAKAVHPDRKTPWIKAHFATSPREFVILSPTDIKEAAAKGGKHWTEYA